MDGSGKVNPDVIIPDKITPDVISPNGDTSQSKLAPISPISNFIDKMNKGLAPIVPNLPQSFIRQQEVPVTEYQSNTGVNLDEYKPYIKDITTNDPNILNKERAENQSGIEQFGHSLGQLVTGAVGGFMQATGINLDLKQALDTVTGTQQEYGNWLTNAGDAVTKWGQDKLPIYETNPGTFNPSDPGWWFNKVAQAGPMVGMAGETLAETAGITALTGGLGLPEALGAMGDSMETMKKIAGLGTNTERLKASATVFGLINRHNMSMMSASQAGDEEYKSLIAKGLDEDTARAGAAKAASATYLSQMPLVALDILGFKAMTFNPVTQVGEGGLADQIVDNVFGHIANPTLKAAAVIGAESTKGAFEGAWMNLSSDYGKYLADRLVDPKADNQKGEQLNDYIKASQLGDVATSGFIGGAITGGLFKGYANLTEGSAKNSLDTQYKTFVDGMASGTSELVGAINKASSTGDEQEANNLRQQLGIHKALTAVHLDQIQGETAAFGGYKNMLQTTLDTANSTDPDALKNIGLEGQGEFLKQNIPQYLQDADHIKSIYDDTKEHNKPDAVIPITYRKFLIDNLNDQLDKTNANIALSTPKDISNLSSYGSDLFDHNITIAAKTKQLDDINQQLKDSSVSSEDRENLKQIKDQIQTDIAFSQEKINPANDTRTPIEKSKDNDILNSTDSTKYSSLIDEQAQIEKNLANVRKGLAIWQDPKYQAKKTQAKIADIINRTETTDDIHRAAIALDSQNLLTPEVEQALVEKKKTIEAKDEAQTLKNKTVTQPFGVPESPLYTHIKANTSAPEVQAQDKATQEPFGQSSPPDIKDLQGTNLSDERKELHDNLSKDIFKGEIGKVENNENKIDINSLNKGDTFYHEGIRYHIATKGQTDLYDSAINMNTGNSKLLSNLPNKVYKEQPTPNVTIVPDEPLFDPAPIDTNKVEDEQRENIKSKVNSLTSSLKSDIGKEPSFEDLMSDAILHSTKDQVDRIWNVYKLGWGLNHPDLLEKALDSLSNSAYVQLFGDRSAITKSFYDLANDIITTQGELTQATDVSNQKEVERQADPGEFDLTEDGEQIHKPIGGLRTVSSTLKMAHLSISYLKTLIRDKEGNIIGANYKDTSNEPNIGQYVDSRELMNPDKWAVGTKGQAQIAEGFGDIPIAQWDENWDSKPAIKFSEWAKDKDPDSDEYISRLPMTIHNSDGKAVSMVADMEWYNPSNIGYADSKEEQQRIIDDAKRELLALRKEVINNNKLDIEVNEKKPGSLMWIPEDKPLKTISEVDPDTKIGYGLSSGNLQTKDRVVSSDNLINKKETLEGFKSGWKYELRQAGLNEEGEPTYFASQVLYPKLEKDAQSSIIQALRTYAFRDDSRTDEASLKQKEQLSKVQKDILEQTGINIHSALGLQNYLNMFMPTYNKYRGDGSADKVAKEIGQMVNNDPSMVNFTPYIATQGGAVYFGIKGKYVDAKGQKETGYFFPGSLKNPDSVNGISSLISGYLQRMSQDDFLGKISQNVDGNALQKDTKVSHISDDGTVIPQSNYDKYLKHRLQTRLLAHDIGEDKVASFVQPTVHFTYDKQKAELQGKIDNKIKESKKVEDEIPQTETQPIELNKDEKSKIIDKIVNEIDEYKALGLSPEDIKILQSLKGGDHSPDFDPDYEKLTDDIVRKIKTKLSGIGDLDSTDRNNVVKYIYAEALSRIDPKSEEGISKEKLRDDIRDTFDNLIKPKAESARNKVSDLMQVLEDHPGLKGIIDTLNNTVSNADVLDKHWNELVNEASDKYLEKITGISIKMSRDQKDVQITPPKPSEDTPIEINTREEDQRQDINPDDQREKNYSKESIEDNFMDSAGFEVKKFFSLIPQYDKKGSQKQGFMGVPVYSGFNDNAQAIGAMLSARGPIISDWNDMITRLQSFSESNPMVNEAIKRLNAADSQFKNKFMYVYSRDPLSMKFPMSSYSNKSKNYQLKVYDTNANEILRVIQTKWKNNFNQSDLVNSDGEINQVRAKSLLDTYNNWMDKKILPSAKEIDSFLNEFGINLSKDSLNELMTKGYYIPEGKSSTLLTYVSKDNKPGKMFGDKALFGFLKTSLENMINEKENLDYTENDKLNPYEDTRGVIDKISNIEAKYSQNLTTNSFRDNGKGIFGFTPGKLATALVYKLKSDPEFVRTKQQISYDGNSFILNLLADNPDFRGKFGIDHVGLTAFRLHGKPIFGDSNNLNQQADPDGELARLGFFQDSQGEVRDIKGEFSNGIPLRIARMPGLTMSDKAQAFVFPTAVLDLRPEHFTESGDMGNQLKEFTFSQLVKPDLDRIISHYKRAFEKNTNPNFLTNDKGYNLAAQLFNSIPRMNDLDYTQENGTKIKLLDFLAHSENNITPEVKNQIIEKIKPQAYEFLNDLIKRDTEDKLKDWEENGYIKRDSEDKVSGISFLDHSYLSDAKRPGTPEQKLNIAAKDYIINTLIHDANQHMLIAGDIANYSQDKLFANRFKLDEQENPQIWKPLRDGVYQDLNREIGINMGKRLAMLNAPGNTIANSVGDKYIQLFARDRVSSAENLPFLIGLYHGNEGKAWAEPYIKILKESNDPIEIKNLTKKIGDKFPDLKAYLNIESTDAQEYTTAKEHTDIVYRQGRMTDLDYQRIGKILMAQRAVEKKTGSIPENLFLTTEDIKLLTDPLVFQPQKPVVTGQMPNIDDDMSRMIYIKSSAFPLLPQITQGTEMNEVRKGMEDVQEREGKNVRLSYDSANKVGAPLSSKQIQLWDNQGKYIPGAIDADKINLAMKNGIPTSALVLDRENFRIQQDVPYRPEHQTETFGTQMMKEIFGDGVGKITDNIFDYNGKKVSGVELQRIVNDHIDKWTRNEKTKLYNKYGIDEDTGVPRDFFKTIQKLQSGLQQEARKRGYPQQDIDALEVTPIYGEDGKTIRDAQFTIPLWLSPNSNRMESLLNSIVTSKLIDLKLPGSAQVVGSEEGFRTSQTPEEDQKQYDARTIYNKNWKGNLQPANYDEKGNFQKPQVLAPSKFRDNDGKLLDLFKKGDDGKELYIHKDEQGLWRLNEDIFDNDLKSNTAFRIPTSNHQSMSQDEMVGFLPPEAGNLRIYNKDYTKQKGIDNDIDQEHTYQLWHGINDNGKIVPIDQLGTDLSNYDEHYQDIKDALTQTQSTIQENSELHKLIDQYKDEIAVSDQYDYNPKDARKFISQLKGDINYNIKKSDLKDLVGLEKEYADLKTKLHQNEIIKAYSSILGNGDERVQQKINKVLSTDFAEEQADLLDRLTNEGEDNKNFTTLSDRYQKDKMTAGAVGKLAIGVYANYTTFHALIQQSDKQIGLTTKDEKGDSIPYKIQIGNLISDGVFGKQNMLTEDGKNDGRNISNVIGGEKVSTATDAEKLRTLDRTGINGSTINVDAALTDLGFDKASAKIDSISDKPIDISVPYFLLSQPIIKDFVRMMENAKAKIAEYNPKAEEDIINKLNTKYSNNGTLDYTDQGQINSERARLTGTKLADNIVDKGQDGVSQQTILHLFRELSKYGETLRDVQSKLNIQRNGLGKSIFEMLEKYNNISALANNGSISNISSLVGDYITDLTHEDLDNLKKDGYVLFNMGGSGDYVPLAVKPLTATGSLMIHSAKSAYELWNRYFPHSNPTLKKTIDDYISMSSSESKSATKKLELQYKVFEKFKKYLYTSSALGLFKGNPADERERLFMDRGDKEALATYLNKFTRSGHENSDILLNNQLVKKFTYDLQKGKLPSIIRYDNARGEDADEEYKYQALIELMDKNAKIDDFQGQPYTTRKLAKDLVNYEYLGDPIQEAIQFVKYIPIAYLKEMGFDTNSQKWQRAANGELFDNPQTGEKIDLLQQILGTSSKDLETTEYPRFLQQAFQHDPGDLPKLSVDNIDSKDREYQGAKTLDNLTKFLPQSLDEPKPYMALYNKDSKLKNKNQIYKFDGKAYNRIPNLGIFGMSEYSIKDNNVRPLIDTNREPVPANLTSISQQDNTIQTSFFDLDKGHLGNTLDKIIGDKTSGVSDMLNILRPYLKGDIGLKVGDTRGRGQYLNGDITINQDYLNNPNTTKEDIARAITHEYIHSLTVDRINQFVNPDGTLKLESKDMPSDIMRLHRLFEEYAKHLGPKLDEFKEWYQEHPGQIRDSKDRMLYAGLNMKEFAAMIGSEEGIQLEANKIQYKQSGKTLGEQFIFAIKKVLSAIGIDTEKPSFTEEALGAVMNVIETQGKETDNINKYFNTFGKALDTSNDDKINEALNKLRPQDDLDDEKPESNIDLSPEEQKQYDHDCIF